MKMKFLHIILFASISLSAIAQNDNYVGNEDEYVLDKDSLKVKDKIHYKVFSVSLHILTIFINN